MFKKIKSVSVPEYNGVATVYQHECGMEVLHIKNDSEELSGNFIFSTASEDNTGVAHIIEHTVLCGSERFPVKDPFSQILLTSPNTFLNAMTFPDKTMYPFASPLKKDFDTIFDIYADAVFAPLLRKESFHQEGVRFCTGNVDGVVFNEMQGVFSSEDDIICRFLFKKLFEGTPSEFESGGDPRFIPDLTYEDYLARYKKWYNPANCRMFLYGNMDAEEYMNRIEERYLTPERLKKNHGEKLYELSDNYLNPEAVPVCDVQTCPAKDASNIILSWLTEKADDPFETLALSVLTDILLGNPGAPLYKAITDSGLGEDLSPVSGMGTDHPVLTFAVGFTGAKKNAEKEIENYILSVLKKLATEGIDIEQQKACMKRQKFKLQEIPGDGFPYGTLVGLRASRFWLRGKDPIACIDNVAMYNRLEKEFEKGHFFEDLIMKSLVNNPRRCLLTVKEDLQYSAKMQTVIDEKYRKLVKESGQEIEKDRKIFENFVATDDSEENLNKIPRILKADLPEKIPQFALNHSEINGLSLLHMNTFTRGITYFNIAFDMTGCSEEEIKLIPLLTRALQMCGTKKFSYSEIGVLIKKLTGSFSIEDSCGTKQGGNPASYLLLKCSSLTEDVKDTLNLIREILTEIDFSDTSRISASVTDLITDWESEYISAGHMYSMMYCSAQISKNGQSADYINGTAGYLATKKFQNASETELKTLSEELEKLRRKIVCRNNMVVDYCCDDNDNDTVKELVVASVDEYPQGEKAEISEYYKKQFNQNLRHEYIAVSSGPAYNALAVKVPYENERELVCASLLASILHSGNINESIRGKGGAYGAGCYVDMTDKTLLCYSYRDPNIERTYEWYENAFASEITEKNIDYTVAAVIGKELRPYVPKAKNSEAFRRYLYNLSDNLYLERRKNILSLTLDEIKKMAEKMHVVIKDKSSRVTICGKDMIKSQSDDVIHLQI